MNTPAQTIQIELIYQIVMIATWLTDVINRIKHLNDDMNTCLHQHPTKNLFADVVRIDDQLQQHARIAQRIDRQFQSLMADYCRHFNNGNDRGEFGIGGDRFQFWRDEDGKYNLIEHEQSKVIEFNG